SADDLMVGSVPGPGGGYLRNIFPRTCLQSHGFDTNAAEPVAPQRIGTAYLDGTDPAATQTEASSAEVPALELQVGDLIAQKTSWLPGALPEVVVALLDAPVADAVSTMNRYGIDAITVVYV